MKPIYFKINYKRSSEMQVNYYFLGRRCMVNNCINISAHDDDLGMCPLHRTQRVTGAMLLRGRDRKRIRQTIVKEQVITRLEMSP